MDTSVHALIIEGMNNKVISVSPEDHSSSIPTLPSSRTTHDLLQKRFESSTDDEIHNVA